MKLEGGQPDNRTAQILKVPFSSVQYIVFVKVAIAIRELHCYFDLWQGYAIPETGKSTKR